jgi:hypothetical protein
MRLPSQRTAGAIGGASAAVLVVSMFLEWYSAKLPSGAGRAAIGTPTYNAFEALERSDVYLVVAAAVGILFAGLLLARVISDSVAPALLLLAAGLFALALVIYRGISRPVDPVVGIDMTLRFGWVIALLAAGSMALAGLLAYLRWLEADKEGDSPGRGDTTAEE